MPTRTAPPATDPGPQGPVVEFASVKEMARALGCSTKYAYTLLDSGAVESRYLGRRRLVSWDSLNAFLANLPTSRG